MKYLLDEFSLQELSQLLPDRLALFLIKASQALLHRLGVRLDVKGVLSDLPQDARHVRGTPREDVGIGTEKVDEHCFLFGVEGGADPQRLALAGTGVEGYSLGVLGSLEATRMLGGVVDIVG